jgi:hypothetical protein
LPDRQGYPSQLPGVDGDDGAPGAPGVDGDDGAPGADGLDVGGFQTVNGLYVPSSVNGLAAPAAGGWNTNEGIFTWFVPKADITIGRLAVVVSTLDAGDVDLSAAVFSLDLATRHLTTGTLTGWSTSVGRKVLSFTGSHALVKGTKYIFGLAVEGTTVQLIRHGTVSSAAAPLIGSTPGDARAFGMAACVPMPAGGSVVPDYTTPGRAPFAALLTP